MRDSNTAAALPPEVITEIVLQARLSYQYWPLGSEDKRDISACSLVCRYWAGLMRVILFYDLSLRTHGDFMFLRDMLDCPIARPGPPLAQCISKLRIAQFSDWSVSSINILRQIAQRVSPDFITLQVEDCMVSSELPLPPETLRTEHYLPFASFPRSLPSLFIPVTELTVGNVQMRRQSDLVRLLDSLSTVQRCYLSMVTFVEEGGVRRRHRRRPSRLYYLSVYDCGDGTQNAQVALAWTLIGSQKHVRADLEQAGLATLPAMLSLLPVSPHYEVQIEMMSDSISWGLGVFGHMRRTCLATATTFFELGACSGQAITGTTASTALSLLPAIEWDFGVGLLEIPRPQLDRFEELTFQLSPVHEITIQGSEHLVRNILSAIFDGALGRTVRTPDTDFTLSLRCSRPGCASQEHEITGAAILSVPREYTATQDPRRIHLTSRQRADYVISGSCPSGDQQCSLRERWAVASSRAIEGQAGSR